MLPGTGGKVKVAGWLGLGSKLTNRANDSRSNRRYKRKTSLGSSSGHDSYSRKFHTGRGNADLVVAQRLVWLRCLVV